MALAPPGVAHRWSVTGHTIDHWECTTIFDLPADDRARLVVHPGAVSRYTVRLDRAGVRMLLDTIASGEACAVPAKHPIHGDRLLGLRPITLPHDVPWTNRPADAPPYFGPMELYLQLPDAQIEIIFERNRLLRLAGALSMALDELTEADSAR